MRRISGSEIVLKALGLLLLTAAVLKGHELLTVPMANKDLWSWRPFLIFQVEFELALGVWLLSGLFKRLAWLATLACFSLFCCVTLYKALTGAASCGCFGRVHVNPWITLFAVDFPALILLAVFRPPAVLDLVRDSWLASVHIIQRSRPSFRRSPGEEQEACLDQRFARRTGLTPADRVEFAFGGTLVLLMLLVSTPVLAVMRPPKMTSRYAVLEPETWLGRRLPILPYVDIADRLGRDCWLVIFHHYNCAACRETIPKVEQMCGELTIQNGDPVRLALIQVPPYGRDPIPTVVPTALGRLSDTKEWFVSTPTVVCLKGGIVVFEKEGTPDLPTILKTLCHTEGVAVPDRKAPKVERR